MTFDRIPGLAERVRAARVQAGLTDLEAATKLGESVAAYSHVESDDSAPLMSVSVDFILRMLALFHVSVESLFGPGSGKSGMTFADLASRIHEYMRSQAIDVAQFEAAVQWKVGSALLRSAEFGEFNLDGLHSVATPVGVDWRDVLQGEMAIRNRSS